MNKKYKLVVAFLLTLLLVLGTVPASFAEPKPDEGTSGGGTSIHLKDNSKEGITGVMVYFNSDKTPVTLELTSGNNWEASDSKGRVLDDIAKIVVTFSDKVVSTYIYDEDFGKQGGKEDPIEYSAEGGGSGSINLWLNEQLIPDIQLEKSVNQEFVDDREDEVTYTFKITNTGNTDLIYVILKDTTIGAEFDIGDLNEGESTTRTFDFSLSILGEDINSDWDGDTFTNLAQVWGTHGDQEVTATDDAIVTYTDEPITPGGIRVFKNVPNVSDSSEEFLIQIFDNGEKLVTSGSISETKPFEINGLTPGKYWVEEEPNSTQAGLYITDEYGYEVNVPVDGYGEVTFVNTLKSGPTSGAIEIMKDVPQVTPSAVLFTFGVYDGDALITTGSASEIHELLISGLDPGKYYVVEDPAVGYDTPVYEKQVTVVAGETTHVTFTNNLINNTETSDPAIQVIKTVSPTEVSSRTTTVTYTFTIANPGDYDLYEISLTDPAIGLNLPIGNLAVDATTTASVTFNLGLLGTDGYGSWDGDKFVNKVTVVGYTKEQEKVSATDDATVTYSSGGGGGGGGHHRTTTTVIPNEPTPAAPVEIPLIEEPVPAAPLPQTGGVPALLFFGIGSLLAGGGALLRKKIK